MNKIDYPIPDDEDVTAKHLELEEELEDDVDADVAAEENTDLWG